MPTGLGHHAPPELPRQSHQGDILTQEDKSFPKTLVDVVMRYIPERVLL
jgi:hypothetical protein